MFSGFEEIDVAVANATIHARVGGNGPPLLLLHGYPQTHVRWHVTLDDLVKSNRVVVPDLRGYGDSVAHDCVITFRALARDEITFRAPLGITRFDVVSPDSGADNGHRTAVDLTSALRSS